MDPVVELVPAGPTRRTAATILAGSAPNIFVKNRDWSSSCDMRGRISSFDLVTSSYPTPCATHVDSAPIMRRSAGIAARIAAFGAEL